MLLDPQHDRTEPNHTLVVCSKVPWLSLMSSRISQASGAHHVYAHDGSEYEVLL